MCVPHLPFHGLDLVCTCMGNWEVNCEVSRPHQGGHYYVGVAQVPLLLSRPEIWFEWVIGCKT